MSLTGRPLTAGRVVGALVVLKALDVVLRGPQALPPAAWLAVLLLWTLSGLALVAGREAWAGVAVAGAALAVDLPLELRRQHLVLLVGVAVVAALTRDGAERLLLWRVQLSVLYGVTALAKLNESFLGGDVLATALDDGPLATVPPLPLLLAAGASLVLVEAGLAVAVWVPRLRQAALIVAAALHTGALLLVSADPLVALRLVVFGGTALVLWAVSAGVLPAGADVRPCAPSSRAGR